MAKSRKKKRAKIIHLSSGPLPSRFDGQFAGQVLAFCDASVLRHGGMAVVFFDGSDSSPLIKTQTLAAMASNELEMQALLFAIAQASACFPNRKITLFSDNQDAVIRLSRLQSDPQVADDQVRCAIGESGVLTDIAFRWIKGHSSCRGNALADQHARAAALA